MLACEGVCVCAVSSSAEIWPALPCRRHETATDRQRRRRRQLRLWWRRKVAGNNGSACGESCCWDMLAYAVIRRMNWRQRWDWRLRLLLLRRWV